MSGSLVLERAIEVQDQLLAAGIDNAIGGALALAYYVDDPRATQDIDVNVSLPATSAREALLALPPGIPWDAQTVAHIEADEQVRILWPVSGQVAMPLDLFFAADPFHEQVRLRTVTVSMLDKTVKIVSSTDLTIFKCLFDRPKDWLDVTAMLEAHDSSVDLGEVIAWLTRFVGADDSRITRLRELVP